MRLAALSDAGVMFVYTHDSVGVGEDGPTHEPVEHLMALRAMPHLHVVRPSDANETLDLVEQFLSAPEPVTTAMVLSRQDMAVFNESDAEGLEAERPPWRLRRARERGRGLHAGCDRLRGPALSERERRTRRRGHRDPGRRVAVLALLRRPDERVPTGVLRRDIPSVSLEAGATLGWTKYVDQAIGIDSFGMSAPGGLRHGLLQHQRGDGGRARARSARRATMTKLDELFADYGQSPWIDNIRRDWLNDGTLAGMVAEGVRGVTSNPSIFAKTLATSSAYDDMLEGKADVDVEVLFEELAVRDVRDACDVLASVHTASSVPSPRSSVATATASSRSRSRRDSRATPWRR